jgi:hypothetical protein
MACGRSWGVGWVVSAAAVRKSRSPGILDAGVMGTASPLGTGQVPPFAADAWSCWRRPNKVNRRDRRGDPGAGQISVSGPALRAVSVPEARVFSGSLGWADGAGRDHRNVVGQRLAMPVSGAVSGPSDQAGRDWTPAQPEALINRSNPIPIFRDGLMATPSAGAGPDGRVLFRNPEWFRIVILCELHRHEAEGTSGDFGWHRRQVSPRIPKLDRIDPFARPRTRRTMEADPRQARCTWPVCPGGLSLSPSDGPGVRPMIDQEAVDRFMKAPWLAEVDREPKLALLNALSEERAKAGTILLAQGQPNDHLTFLIDGSVDLERTFENGRKDLVTTLNAPAVFGTTSFFQPKPPTVTARARTDVWMLTLYHPAHDALRRDSPRAAEALALAVVRTLSERFDLIDRMFTEYILSHPDVPPKTASEWSRFRARLFEEHTQVL